VIVTVSEHAIGLVGLAVMGENLALNIEEKGFPIAVFNRSTAKVDDFLRRNPGKKIHGAKSPADLSAALARPRRIIMMVKAGQAVDDTIAALKPHLEKGDILIDGGNSWYLDTERRTRELAQSGILYLGMGVSGGEEGARNGPSLMPGGSPEAYGPVQPIATKISAQVPGPTGGACVEFLGPGGSGHYVKMVHNGIEYADMQIIAEAYDLLHRLGGLSNAELADVFSTWNQGELSSFLIEITAQIFRTPDKLGGSGELVDKILDTAGQKGTGRWTSQNALELGVAATTMSAAVDARVLSAGKDERRAASQLLKGPAAPKTLSAAEKKQLIDDVRQALYCAKVCAYAQGMNILRIASRDYKWNLPLAQIARIWKGGCIIRAAFLDKIRHAFEENRDLANLLVDPGFKGEVEERQPAWRRTVQAAVAAGIPCLAMSTALGYFDMYRSERLPANLIQAQRDFFGAHTFGRTDREGVYHADWSTGESHSTSGGGH
jgi:6-phosphogluconate dehydrogenase